MKKIIFSIIAIVLLLSSAFIYTQSQIVEHIRVRNAIKNNYEINDEDTIHLKPSNIKIVDQYQFDEHEFYIVEYERLYKNSGDVKWKQFDDENIRISFVKVINTNYFKKEYYADSHSKNENYIGYDQDYVYAIFNEKDELKTVRIYFKSGDTQEIDISIQTYLLYYSDKDDDIIDVRLLNDLGEIII